MLHPPTFARFEDAYTAVLEHVGGGFEYVTNARGNPARECLNVSFVLTDPCDRIVFTPARRTNIVFCFAEVLWYLWGRDDLEMISYYAPGIASNSADGVRLTGTAYGTRLFRAGQDGRSQWQRVTEMLRAEQDSKRAVMGIFDPAELTDAANPDVSCTLGMQFLLREGVLHATTYMRGNDAVVGLLNDVFAATLIQEFTARHLGVQLGTYGHHVGSMHINKTTATRAQQVIATTHRDHPPFTPLPMPPTSWDELRVVEEFEERLRTDTDRLDPADPAFRDLPVYWRQVVLLLDTYRQLIHYPDRAVGTSTLRALTPAYRWLIANRWPDRLSPRPPVTEGAVWSVA